MPDAYVVYFKLATSATANTLPAEGILADTRPAWQVAGRPPTYALPRGLIRYTAREPQKVTGILFFHRSCPESQLTPTLSGSSFHRSPTTCLAPLGPQVDGQVNSDIMALSWPYRASLHDRQFLRQGRRRQWFYVKGGTITRLQRCRASLTISRERR